MRPQPTSAAHPPKSPEGVFASKYEWLLRWALHFSQNDKTVAEDLIQETFVKLLISWKTLKDLDNIEPLLYTYLKYSYLTEFRRSESYSLQSLSAIDFDSLPRDLWTANLSDQIELQDELQRIVTFLLWRKSCAKFASIFLLRFFHGYFPEEIMRICMITRHAVDLSLRHARGEVKSYLADPARIQILRHPPPPEAVAPRAPVSPHQFVDELRGLIFSARFEACLPLGDLQEFYEVESQKPVDSRLLAHIVSCESCLDKVSRLCNLPPGSKRSPWDSFGPAPRSQAGKRSSDGTKQEVKRAIESGHRRLREIYEHHPRGLMIALNGQVIAVRDISSPRGVLKIETHSVASLELIEVISDQGLPLLMLPVLQRPPEAPPTISHDVELSQGRRVSLLLSFTSDGAVIEVTYEEPAFIDEGAKPPTLAFRSDRHDVSDRCDDPGQGLVKGASHKTFSSKQDAQQRTWWPRFFRMPRMPHLLSSAPYLPVAAFATLLVIVVPASLYWLNATRHRLHMQGAAFLEKTAAVEKQTLAQGAVGVIHQRVNIQTASRTIRRDLYRDIQGRRRAKEQTLNKEVRALRARLAEASFDWNDPLSAGGYKGWHDHVIHRKDVVKQTGNNLLALITTSSDGGVLQESLTVRASDFQPVERSVQFEDHEVVQIAELTYEVVPWGPAIDNRFEVITPSAGVATDVPSPLLTSHLAAVTPAVLDEAEMRSLLVLQHLHADRERIEVVRTTHDVQVRGIVDTDERKRQIELQLRSISHVTPSISSYRDLDSRPSSQSDIHSLASISVGAQPGLIEKYCDDKGWDKDECRKISFDLLDSSTVILQESRKIAALLTEFSPDRPLTLTAESILDELIVQHGNRMAAAIQQQERALAISGVTVAMSEHNVTAFNVGTLLAAAQHNLDLSKELTYAADDRSRPAQSAFVDLARSVEEIRATASGVAAAHQSASVSPSHVLANSP